MRNKVRGKAMALPIGVCIGAFVGLAVVVLLVVLLAGLVLGGRVLLGGVGYYLAGALYIASLIATMISVRAVKRRRLLVSACTAGVIFLLLVMVNLVWCGSDFRGIWTVGLFIAAGAISAAMLGGVGARRGNKLA